MKVLAMVLAAMTFALSACGASQPATSPDDGPPAKVEKIEGSDLKRITLTPKAASRLGIELTAAGERQIPYSALLYDPTGVTWVYLSPQPLVFQRQKVVVDAITQGRVALSDGPAAGTQVVTIGVAELYGAENGLS